MNTSTLKAFAPVVRRQLIEAVTRKLDFVLSAQTPDYLTTFAPQVAALRELARVDRAGLIERVAYTWFNRFAALRYLDARGWHPFRARVLTPFSLEETQPELLKLTRNGNLPEELRRHTNPDRLNDLLDGRIPTAIPDADPQGEVYRHLVLAACRLYYTLLPDLFEKLDDETELLLPDDLLTEHSVAHGFRTEITDDDCAEVELLGWLYQFYIAEKKDAVMARKSAVPTEDIPAVTQLFTPHWIVRYLVENSLGRLWLLNRPDSRLREQMPYYIEGETETEFLKITKPEEIHLLDPAVGSGHMLTYAFDLLYAIYEEEGYAPTEIAGLILTHNLYGIDIDQRAAQLASMALVLKAREKSRRVFQRDEIVRPHIIALQDVIFEEGELREYIRTLKLGDLFDQPVMQLMRQFEHATTFGSLIQPCLDEVDIAFVRSAIDHKDLGSQMFLRDTHLKVLRVLEQAEALTERYQVVVANPPYMGSRQMNGRLRVFADERYSKSKSDLLAMFIERSLELSKGHGVIAMITMHSWMFLSAYDDLRSSLLNSSSLITLAHFGPRAFDSISGEVVQTVAFCIKKIPSKTHAICFRLVDGSNEAEKERALLQRENRFLISNSEIQKLPRCVFAYWLDEKLRHVFDLKKFGDISDGEGKNVTADNARFLRLVWEVESNMVGRGKKWLRYAKGGANRKWAGNLEHVVDWSESSRQFYRKNHASRIIEERYWYRSGITWSVIGGSGTGFRHLPEDTTYDTKGLALFTKDTREVFAALGLMNSVVTEVILPTLNPTMCINTVDVKSIPIPEKLPECSSHVNELVEISRADWDNFETSWDFRDQPLVRTGTKSATLQASWETWEAQSTAAIRRTQELETENNRLFIAAYGLDNELQPEVPEAQITLSRADARRDMAAFLSYAVGCMMGRYSLDEPGMILADSGDTLADYQTKVGKPLDQITFTPDEDGIIPVLDGEWFEDDIVARTREFLGATFGKSTLRENIAFLDESLGKDLRKYFLADFYKNHISNERAYGYKKRPIYWLVQSPKKGFSALIYLHRYTRDTMNLVLNRYLRPYQDKLRSRLENLAQVQLDEGVSARQKTDARKEADKLTKTLRECEEWERDTVLPLAQARIELDLDDGVKVNYQKLGEALAPIAGLAAAEE